jgi:hypothetical protein
MSDQARYRPRQEFDFLGFVFSVMAGCDRGLEACAVIEREQDVYRGAVGHDDILAFGTIRLPSSHET